MSDRKNVKKFKDHKTVPIEKNFKSLDPALVKAVYEANERFF